jgi:NADH:ubiquinone reductase (H+-translocating)
MTDNSTSPSKVVVIGGGYSGALAANHLRLLADVDITLVNPRPRFVQRIRLHQHAAGNYDATVDYGTLLGEGVRLVVDSATRIDTTSRTVHLASGRVLDYDYVIYAVGSTGKPPSSVPGAAEFALPIGEFEDAEALRAQLSYVDHDAPVCVVGGGLTGIETASELAQERSSVTLICGPMLAPSLSPQGRRSVARQLDRLGVTVLEDRFVTEVRADAVVLADGRELPSAVTIWTAGFGVPQLAASSGLRSDALGRLLTDETLTSVQDVRIVAAGDAAAPSGQPLRMSCQAAGPLGAQAANTVLSRIAGEDPAMVNQAFVAQCISLGRSGATFQLARKDDTPVRFYLGGKTAAALKEFICKATVKHIEKEARKPGSYSWFKGGRRVEQPEFEPEVVTES